MDENEQAVAKAAANRVIELEEEVEASGYASVDGAALEKARAALHAWIDGMTAVVISPALGRVTLIHANGRQSTITSPDLPFVMSRPGA
jgi:hypothetical protein